VPKLSLAKLERHLYSAADRLRQEGLDAATYKDYIFGLLFLKRCSDVFDAEREKIVRRKVEEGVISEPEAEATYGETPDFYDTFFVPERARWTYLMSKLLFADRGTTDLQGQVERCVELLEDMRIRADFINKLRMFYETLNVLEHRPEVPAGVFRDAKLLGFINKVAANLYRDPALNLLGVAEKVKALINAHISARGVDPKIPPTSITDEEFEKVLQAQSSSRARGAQMQHAARYHLVGFSNQNPAYARKMSEKLEEILQRFKDDWDALERELRRFIEELKLGDRSDFPDLDPTTQVPFVRFVLEDCSKGRDLTGVQRTAAIAVTLEMVERIRQEVRKVGFWKNPDMRELLTRTLVRDLDQAGICRPGTERDLAQRLVALAKENHENLVRP